MRSLIRVTIFLFFATGLFVAAKVDKIYGRTAKGIYFNIKFKGKDIYPDSMKVVFGNSFINSGNLSSFYSQPAGKNQFIIRLPLAEQFGVVDMYSSLTGYLFQRQITEPGDSIVAVVNYRSRYDYDVHFSGRGAEKYQFAQAVNLKSDEIALTGQAPFAINKSADSSILAGSRLLKNYKGISKNARELLDLELTGHVRMRQIANFRFGIRKQVNSRQGYFTAFQNIRDTKPVKDDIAIDLISYIDYLYEKNKLELIFKFGDNEVTTGKSFSVRDLYDHLKRKYTGVLRERLLVYCLTNYFEIDTFFYGFDSEDHTICLNDALTVVSDTGLRQILAKHLSVIGKGVDAYDFSLPNERGELIDLHDFKGKIVLIDVWGNPCGGCLKFKKEFEKEVYPFLKDNEKFSVITVNVNVDKEKWLSGIPVYSHEGFINVYTAGLGMDHPFIKHYGITGIPYLLLVDENTRVISSTVPFTGRGKELLQLIQTYLDRIP